MISKIKSLVKPQPKAVTSCLSETSESSCVYMNGGTAEVREKEHCSSFSSNKLPDLAKDAVTAKSLLYNGDAKAGKDVGFKISPSVFSDASYINKDAERAYTSLGDAADARTPETSRSVKNPSSCLDSSTLLVAMATKNSRSCAERAGSADEFGDSSGVDYDEPDALKVPENSAINSRAAGKPAEKNAASNILDILVEERVKLTTKIVVCGEDEADDAPRNGILKVVGNFKDESIRKRVSFSNDVTQLTFDNESDCADSADDSHEFYDLNADDIVDKVPMIESVAAIDDDVAKTVDGNDKSDCSAESVADYATGDKMAQSAHESAKDRFDKNGECETREKKLASEVKDKACKDGEVATVPEQPSQAIPPRAQPSLLPAVLNQASSEQNADADTRMKESAGGTRQLADPGKVHNRHKPQKQSPVAHNCTDTLESRKAGMSVDSECEADEKEPEPRLPCDNVKPTLDVTAWTAPEALPLSPPLKQTDATLNDKLWVAVSNSPVSNYTFFVTCSHIKSIQFSAPLKSIQFQSALSNQYSFNTPFQVNTLLIRLLNNKTINYKTVYIFIFV